MRQWFRIAFPRNYLDRRKRAGFLFVLPALLFFGSVFLLPLAQSILYSFYKIAPGGAKEFVGLRLYERVLTDSTFWTAVGNTVQLLLFSVPVTVVLALAVALGLNRISNLKWRNVWASMYFLPFATSLVAAALIWQWIYEPVYGFLNYALSFVGIPPQKWLQSLVAGAAVPRCRERLGADRFRHDDLPCRAAIDSRGVLRGGQHGRRQWHAATAVHHAAAAECPDHHGLHSRTHIQFQDLRSGVRHHPGRAGGRESDHHHACCTTPRSNSSASATPPVMAVFVFVTLMLVTLLQWRFFRKPVEY